MGGNHRFHHAHADQPDDPHSPRDGFWHAHNGWYIGRKDALSCVLYALAGPLRILFDGVHRPRSNQQHVHLAPDVAADPWYRWVSRPGPYLAFAIAHVVLFFGGAFWLFGWAGVAALWLTLVAIFNLGDAIDSVAHIVGEMPYGGEDLRAQPLGPRPPLPGRRLARAPPPLPVERPPRSGTRAVGRELAGHRVAGAARAGAQRPRAVGGADSPGARRRAGGDPCRRRLSPPRPPRPRPAWSGARR